MSSACGMLEAIEDASVIQDKMGYLRQDMKTGALYSMRITLKWLGFVVSVPKEIVDKVHGRQANSYS
jgi:hypothetical protein